MYALCYPSSPSSKRASNGPEWMHNMRHGISDPMGWIHSDETSSSLDVFALTGAPPLVPHTNHSHPLSFSSDLHDSRAARPSSFGGRTIQTILGGASEREVRRRRRIASIFTRGCNKIEQFIWLGIHLMHVLNSCKSPAEAKISLFSFL